MEFQDDWPGLFIRGDHAYDVLRAIRRLQQHCSNHKHWEVRRSLELLNGIAEVIENDVLVGPDDDGELFAGKEGDAC